MIFGKTLLKEVTDYIDKLKEKERLKIEEEQQRIETERKRLQAEYEEINRQASERRAKAEKTKQLANKAKEEAMQSVKDDLAKIKLSLDEKFKVKANDFLTELNTDNEKILTILCNKTVISVIIKIYSNNPFTYNNFELFTKAGKKITVSNKLNESILKCINDGTYTVVANLSDFK